jgi:hypothetical protein
MGFSGDLLLVDRELRYTIDILHTGIYSRQELWGIQPPESLLSHLEQCPDDRCCRIDPLEGFGRTRAQPCGGKGDSATFVVRRWRQCSRGN